MWINPAKDHLSIIILSGLEGGHLGILNVYALNMVGEKYVMWYEVIQSLPMDCKWIMTGDFSMVENILNRSMSSCSQLMGLREELAWAYIKRKYNIEVYFSKDDGPLCLWDNIREDGTNILARLDRFTLSLAHLKFHLLVLCTIRS